MSHLRLLSTDFDGTLIEHYSDGRCTPEFAEVLFHHKKQGGVWAVNTGRGLVHAMEGVEKFQAPVQPDFLLTNEREIFHRSREGDWVPEAGWNQTCYAKHDELFENSQAIFDWLRSHVDVKSGISLAEENGQICGVITDTEADMNAFVELLEKESALMPDFSYQRNTIYLRFAHRDYHKGSTLGELCRLLGIRHDEVLAAGDHFNDVPMLNGRYAAYPCCPSNAIPHVRETVLAAGGHIAMQPAANGVAESWHFFHAKRVS